MNRRGVEKILSQTGMEKRENQIERESEGLFNNALPLPLHSRPY
jgi:hypothetical protein